MEFFITEKQRKQFGGSCYFEFQRGLHRGQKNKEYNFVIWKEDSPLLHWKEDSLLLHMDIADEIELYKVVPDFNYYGITVIDKEKWDIIKHNAENISGTVTKVINELSAWVEENFKEFDYFVILGI